MSEQQSITTEVSDRLKEIIVRSLVRDYDSTNCPQYVQLSEYINSSGVSSEAIIYSNLAISGLTWSSENNTYYIIFTVAIPYNIQIKNNKIYRLKLFSQKGELLVTADNLQLNISQGQTYIANWKIKIMQQSPDTSEQPQSI